MLGVAYQEYPCPQTHGEPSLLARTRNGNQFRPQRQRENDYLASLVQVGARGPDEKTGDVCVASGTGLEQRSRALRAKGARYNVNTKFVK